MFKLIIVLCIFLLLSMSLFAGQSDVRISWTTVKDLVVLEEEIDKSIARNKKTVLFFFASWDINSKKVEKSIWLSRKGLEHYSFIKVDLSDGGVEEKRIIEQYKLGIFIPVLTIISRNGIEIESSRVVGPKIVTGKMFNVWLKAGTLNSVGTRRLSVSSVSKDKRKNKQFEKMDAIFKYHVSHNNNVVIVDFETDKKHYLYKKKFKIKMNGHVVKRSLIHIIGDPVVHTDDSWGEKEVFKEKARLELDLNEMPDIVCNSSNELDIFYQGSGIPQLFYPPQKRRIEAKIDCD